MCERERENMAYMCIRLGSKYINPLKPSRRP